MLGNFSQGKGKVRRPKDLVFSYWVNVTLISLTRSVPLRAQPKFEGFSVVVVEKNS